MLPGLVLFAVFFVWPAVQALQLAFYEYDGISAPVTVGLDNFDRMLDDPRFHEAFVNSFLFLFGMMPLAVAVPLLLAVLVNQKIPGIQAFRLAIVMPVVVSMVAVAVTWKYVLDAQGVLSWLVTSLGISDEPTAWLLSSDWALPCLIVIEGWKSMGIYMMIYLAGLQAIPVDLYEAAQIDGAGIWHRLTKITVPLMIPYVAVTSTMAMLDAMQVFTSVYVMTRGGPQDSTMTLGYYVWSKAFEDYEFGYASAIALVLWAVMIILAVVNYQLTKERR
ncbi:carbohydrate ABC transporter permease [Phytoactinopolyspora endophytica]|uniref:carbohydrate ABC transporter permease n=1 Tax=Phytoactinopolyspora endophytica TaxID=1642495 RepID=UPI00197C8E70|nr:sugar ABC transporter permease [Phytoactinopolyspora endophytica]